MMSSLNANAARTSARAQADLMDQNQPLSSPSLSSSRVAGEVKTLAELSIGEVAAVRQVKALATMPEWASQLEDIGFIVGEPVSLMARGAFGGDPLVVRVGLSTFALRKAEAACVIVELPIVKAAA